MVNVYFCTSESSIHCWNSVTLLYFIQQQMHKPFYNKRAFKEFYQKPTKCTIICRKHKRSYNKKQMHYLNSLPKLFFKRIERVFSLLVTKFHILVMMMFLVRRTYIYVHFDKFYLVYLWNVCCTILCLSSCTFFIGRLKFKQMTKTQ